MFSFKPSDPASPEPLRKAAPFVSLLRTLIGLCSLSLAACSQPASFQAQLALDIELAAATSGSPLPAAATPHLSETGQLIARRGMRLTLIAAPETRDYQRRGYSLEPLSEVRSLELSGGSSTGGQGHLALLQSEKLWTFGKGEGVTVAVIDSGVNPAHPSLAGALLPGYDFVADQFTTDQSAVHDESGHGSAVAALIAGRGPVYGLAPEASVLPLRVLDAKGEGSSYNLAKALLFAADLLPELPNPHKADIINLSLEGPYSETVHEAVKRVKAAGINLVAAAGNGSGKAVSYPAAFAEVLAVGAGEVQQGSWQAASYSSVGAGLDVLAPVGGLTDAAWGRYAENGVLSTGELPGSLRRVHGTSFAAPQVAGLAALLLGTGLEAGRLNEILKLSSSDLSPSGWDAGSGYGIINPVASLRLASVGDQESLTVQRLDRGSLQELSALRSDLQGVLHLDPGEHVLSFHYATRGAHYRALASAIMLSQGEARTLELTLSPVVTQALTQKGF